MIGDQLVEHLELALLGKAEVEDRVVVGRRLGEPGEQGGFRPVQLVGTDAEVVQRSQEGTRRRWLETLASERVPRGLVSSGS